MSVEQTSAATARPYTALLAAPAKGWPVTLKGGEQRRTGRGGKQERLTPADQVGSRTADADFDDLPRRYISRYRRERGLESTHLSRNRRNGDGKQEPENAVMQIPERPPPQNSDKRDNDRRYDAGVNDAFGKGDAFLRSESVLEGSVGEGELALVAPLVGQVADEGDEDDGDAGRVVVAWMEGVEAATGGWREGRKREKESAVSSLSSTACTERREDSHPVCGEAGEDVQRSATRLPILFGMIKKQRSRARRLPRWRLLFLPPTRTASTTVRDSPACFRVSRWQS